jgi:DNA-3-methyladenine glycosylase I
MVAYHDLEWGVPLHDDDRLFEMLCLEGAQAGLSWSTILKRREGYRQVYEGFRIDRVAAFDEDRQAGLLQDARIIRNRSKVAAFRDNARAVLAIQADRGSLNDYLWAFVNGRPVVNRFERLGDLPDQTPLAAAISRDLRGHGLRFVGPTIMYAFMQSVGMVNDHTVDCFRFVELGG